ncbi:dimethylsulfonioproprionate lyase family protein [Defluviimonas sp. WL0024]|uniref:Dimethylsulfonioproprionate lyase family protein n=2 Tax=Albidovulum TaxID=205889 RepID=A0ABT3J302_9RHOB|nr:MULTISPECIES: dimethylsulfonioproprionate lyase family protein [Defluviimonas]MCU9849496.1 dimethylsulfonioproprionate lyase family protein [Defluviimonas sp. WL0024]MCW3782062.1 dimethylsulfonioproprionate lyase family protein [Defluviimonas salinarum]
MHPPAFDALLDALASIYRSEGREAADRTAQALVTTPAPEAFALQPPCALDGLMRDLLATSAHPAAAAILAAQDLIPWGTNPVADRMSDSAAAICAVTTLMGPDGPIPAPDLRLGLFYQRPNSYYALHNHDADETYVILAGQAFWTAGEDRRMRVPGDMIHHPSLMPHAFRTGSEGVLALWRWSGDVNTHSYAFLDDPEELIA